MNRTRVSVPKMDCPAEERLVRMALGDLPGLRQVAIDLQKREATIDHEGDSSAVLSRVSLLNLGATHLTSEALSPDSASVEDMPIDPRQEASTLHLVLWINATMFVAEVVTGYLADSSAVIADSLDMFADAAVYAIALWGVGRAIEGQRRAARVSGALQLALAAGALMEVARRAVFGSEPEPQLIAWVGAAALVANATSMWLLMRHRSGGAHMRASWIFTTNDVIANVGVLIGAAAVHYTGSPIPDLVVGTGIGLVVLSGAIRILRL